MQVGTLSVRSCIAANFTALLSNLPVDLHEHCLCHLSELVHQAPCPVAQFKSGNQKCTTVCTKGWRLRASLAHQLHHLASVLCCNLVCEFLLPHAFQLAEDSVAHVRKEAAHQLVYILTDKHPKQTAVILEQLETWQQSPKFKLRCVAAVICSEAVQKPLMPDTLLRIQQIVGKLQSDAVADVRRLV